MASGNTRTCGRPRVEQDHVGNSAIAGGLRHIICGANADGLDHAQAGARPDRRHALWSFAAVELDDVRSHRADDLIEESVVGVDQHGDGVDASAGKLG